jgi:hypothetical protein
MVALLLAGGDPALPVVVGQDGEGDEDEDAEAEEEFHAGDRIAWLRDWLAGEVRT